jgi:hypothetical protein
MDVEQLGFKAGHAIGYSLQGLAQRMQVFQTLIQAQVLEPVDADL